MNTFINTGKDDSLKAIMDAEASIGGQYFTIASAHVEEKKGIDGFKKVANDFNKVAEMAKSAGLKFAYHNHNHEFVKFGDAIGYNTYLKETDKNLVDFELDLYWVVRSGNDPIQLFKENPSRFTMWHIKDMDKSNAELNTEVGNGSIDFKPIFAEAKLAGLKHFFVEQENNYVPNSIDSIESSSAFIKANLI